VVAVNSEEVLQKKLLRSGELKLAKEIIVERNASAAGKESSVNGLSEELKTIF
jgi:hypothetical protein